MHRVGTHPRDDAMTERVGSNAYLFLNSADRNYNASPGTYLANQAIDVAWNDFRIQRSQQLIGSFARRIRPVDVKFAWSIPNIMTGKNDVIYFLVGATDYVITLPSSFYTPAELATALTAALQTAVGGTDVAPVITYDAVNMRYTATCPATTGDDFIMTPYADPATYSFAQYQNSPSLFKTLGFTYDQASSPPPIAPGAFMTGVPTLSSYTDYVEILSNKIMTYTDVWDGQSGDGGRNAIMRIQAQDETSMNQLTDAEGNTIPTTCRPFQIYRQFKMPKAIKWNPDSTIDWLDISVVDMYGQLVPLPPYNSSSTRTGGLGYYPDFQITLLCSED
jgi:hypothetical protein